MSVSDSDSTSGSSVDEGSDGIEIVEMAISGIQNMPTVQAGEPFRNVSSSITSNSKYPGLDNDQILELEKYKIDKEIEIERIKIDKKERQDLLDKLSPEDRFKLIEKMLLG